MMRRALVLGSAILLPIAFACSSSSDDGPSTSTDDAGGGLDGTPPATNDDAGLDLVDSSVNGTPVRGFVDDATTSLPIVGATVCIESHAEIPCATTLADGSYTLGIPFLPVAAGGAAVDLAITATADGYFGSTRLATELPPGDADSSIVWPEAHLLRNANDISAFAATAGFTYPTQNGFVALRVIGALASDVITATATISPGGTAVYGDDSGLPDPTLKATGASGMIYFGNVPPGEVTIALTVAGKTCTVSPPDGLIAGDWPSGANAIRAVAVASSETSELTAVCE